MNMPDSFDHLTESERRDLDEALAAPSVAWWDDFYQDRSRRCPFFVTHPDESLAQWMAEGLIRPGHAIDIGCGNGRNAIFLARHGFSVQAIDLSGAAIAWAREHAARAGVAVSFAQANVFEMDLAAPSYDLIYDSGCFHHMPPHRRAQYVDLLTAALRPGGWLCLTCFRPEGGSGYSDAEVYERRSLGGGLGYTEERLRQIWSKGLHIRHLRQMKPQEPSSELFGENFLWVLLARKPAA
jgi:SAM-dependent methyltransferase